MRNQESRFNIMYWNRTFLLCSVVALCLDPLFLYIPTINKTQNCQYVDQNLANLLCILRSFADIFFVFHIIIKLRNREYIDAVAKRYLTCHIIIDVLAALPIPQFGVLIIGGKLIGPNSFSMETPIKFLVFYQYVPRVIQASLLYKKVTKDSLFFIEKAWAGAAVNLFLYVLASHIVGALWYFYAIESELRCWYMACKRHTCNFKYLYCKHGRVGDYGFLDNSCRLPERSEINDLLDFDFGLFLGALQARVTETRDFRHKILYCSWWGLQSLSSLGQGLKPSAFYGEILFADLIAVISLVLFAFLIGNMQRYLQFYSHLTHRMEEMKDKRRETQRMEEMKGKTRETEDLMSHISLPEHLRERVRKHNLFKWKTTRSVELDFFLKDLPKDIRRDIIRQLLGSSLERVFNVMSDHLLDAMCDRLKAVFYTKDSYVLREGDLAHEMLFITHGRLVCKRNGFSNEGILTAGDFCGEELHIWALDPISQQRPFSTKTVKALTDVQGFTLVDGDLLFIASQFGRSHSRHSKHIFRAWVAVSVIQAAWRIHSKRKHGKILEANKRLHDASATGINETTNLSLGACIYVSRFSSNVLRILRRNGYEEVSTQPVMPPHSLPSDDGPHIQIQTE